MSSAHTSTHIHLLYTHMYTFKKKEKAASNFKQIYFTRRMQVSDVRLISSYLGFNNKFQTEN